MKYQKTILVIITFFAAGLIVAGCQRLQNNLPTEVETPPLPASPEETTEQPAQENENQPIIEADDQEISGTTVIIKKAVMDQPGWVVIHADKDGEIGEPIGNAKLQQGENTHISVNIDLSKATQKLYAMLHVDEGERGVYEFPGDDKPLTFNGEIVVDDFQVTLPSENSPSPTLAPEDEMSEVDSAKEGDISASPSEQDKENEPAEKQQTKTFSVTAKQWEFIPSTITVQKGDRVKLEITSVDVEHGIAIPEFGVSTELYPGKTATVEFTADKAGTFSFFCNVYCGSGHRDMKGTLRVTE